MEVGGVEGVGLVQGSGFRVEKCLIEKKKKWE